MNYKSNTDHSVIKEHGSESTKHWISQRLSSILLVPCTIVFIITLIKVMDKPFIEIIATYKHPFNNLVAALFLLISLWHFRQGIQVVLEDYIQEVKIRNSVLKISGLLCFVLGVLVIFSFVRIYTIGI